MQKKKHLEYSSNCQLCCRQEMYLEIKGNSYNQDGSDRYNVTQISEIANPTFTVVVPTPNYEIGACNK